MKYTLVTGGAGYIGSKVVIDLLDKGHNVVVIDNLLNGYKKLVDPRAVFYKIDLNHPTEICKVLKKYNIKTIFHFAASVSVPESAKKPLKYVKNNIFATQNLLKSAIKNKIKNFIFSSTCSVYGESINTCVKENFPKIPKSNYALTKFFCENLIHDYSIFFKFNYVILRYFNVIGADIFLRSGQIYDGPLIKTISKNIVRKKLNVTIYGKDYKTVDGTCVRDYIDVNDLSEIHIMALKKIETTKKSLTFNCGYGKPLSVLDIVNAYEKIIRKRLYKRFLPRRTGDIAEIYADNKFLKKLFPFWKPKQNLHSSIKSSLAWEKKILK
jgi:UDP-glucose 4-epimerase